MFDGSKIELFVNETRTHVRLLFSDDKGPLVSIDLPMEDALKMANDIHKTATANTAIH